MAGIDPQSGAKRNRRDASPRRKNAASGPRAAVDECRPAASPEIVPRRAARGEPHLPLRTAKPSGRAAHFCGGDGWGGRDRTYECRNQNPVPYHLATPQRKLDLLGRRLCKRRQRMSCKRPGDASAHVERQQRQRAPRFVLRRERRKHARAGACHPRVRRCARIASRPRPRRGISQPSRARDRCGRNPRKRRLFSPTASYRVNSARRKDLGGAHAAGRERKRQPMRRQR